ncbi:hypothetical protein ACIP82_34535, partial [Kitasatospora sp. NPDC088548]
MEVRPEPPGARPAGCLPAPRHLPPHPATPRSTPVTTSTATAVRTGRAAARATGLNKVYGEGETRVVALD